MIREAWHIATHLDPLSAVVLALAAVHVFCVIIAVITLRQSLRLQRRQEAVRLLEQRLRRRGGSGHDTT